MFVLKFCRLYDDYANDALTLADLNGSLENTAAFYDAYGADIKRQINVVPSNHCIPTDDFGGQCGKTIVDGCENCSECSAKLATKKSRRSSKILFVFVNRLRRRCGIALAKLLNDSGRALSPPDPQYDETLLIPFDQRPFQRLSNEPADWRNGLTSSGLMFIPPACRTKDNATAQSCDLLVLFHGCFATCDLGYVKHNGVLKYAATNRLVVLAPQVGITSKRRGPASAFCCAHTPSHPHSPPPPPPSRSLSLPLSLAHYLSLTGASYFILVRCTRYCIA
jgi:hypothetical protein